MGQRQRCEKIESGEHAGIKSATSHTDTKGTKTPQGAETLRLFYRRGAESGAKGGARSPVPPFEESDRCRDRQREPEKRSAHVGRTVKQIAQVGRGHGGPPCGSGGGLCRTPAGGGLGRHRRRSARGPRESPKLHSCRTGQRLDNRDPSRGRLRRDPAHDQRRPTMGPAGLDERRPRRGAQQREGGR